MYGIVIRIKMIFVNFYTKKCGFNIIGTEMDGNVEVSRFECNVKKLK